MSPLVAIRTCLRKYATFDGRAGRVEYWWFVLPLLAIYFGGDLVIEELYNADAVETAEAMDVVLFVFGITLFLPFVAVTIRRFHDVGLSGWWVPAIWATVFALETASTHQHAITVLTTSDGQATASGISLNPIFGALLALTALLYIAEIIICLWPGQKMENRFGPPSRTTATGPNPHEVTP